MNLGSESESRISEDTVMQFPKLGMDKKYMVNGANQLIYVSGLTDMTRNSLSDSKQNAAGTVIN